MRRLSAWATLTLLVLSACGGDRPPPKAAPTEASTRDSVAFRDLGRKGAAAKMKVVYRVTEDAEISSDLVVAQDPPRRSFRLNDGTDDTLLIATQAGDFIACSRDACFRLPGLGAAAGAAGAAFLGPLTEAFDAFASRPDLPGFSAQGERKIAGRTTICAAWKPDFAPEGFEQCLDKETGIALAYLLTAEEGVTRLEATSVAQPADADFTPTLPVEEIPSDFPTDQSPS